MPHSATLKIASRMFDPLILDLPELAFGERDGHLDDGEAGADGAPGQVDLEAVALRVDGGEVDLLQHLAPVGAVAGGDVVDVDAEQHPRVAVRRPRQHHPAPRPVAHGAAGDVARADRQVGARVDGVEQPVQLLGRVGAVGVHLDQHRVARGSVPRRSRPGRPRRGRPWLVRCMTWMRSGSASDSSSASSPVPSGLPSSTTRTWTSGRAACTRPTINGRFSRSL